MAGFLDLARSRGSYATNEAFQGMIKAEQARIRQHRETLVADGLLERGDHAELAGLLRDQITSDKSPAVYSDGAIYRYDETTHASAPTKMYPVVLSRI